MFEHILTCADLTKDDRAAVETFGAFLRETPAGLTGAPPAEWADFFPGRVEFENWRARWLPYLLGMAPGQTDPQEYARLRPQMFAMRRARDVDMLHTA